jgi:lambda family phage portal protein
LSDKIEVKSNPLDRAIEYVAPVYAAKRFRARALMAVVGSYVGASKTRRATKEWRTTSGDADADTIYDLKTLRERSRDLSRNTPLAVGAISTSLTNVVGTGLKLQSRIDREVLSFTDDDADAWETKTEREFRMWAESRECDSGRQLNFAMIQELAFRQTLENGEVFTLLPRFARPGSPYDLKLQLVEADRVCNEKNAANSSDLVEGIKKDEHGAPVEYQILNQHPGTVYYDPKKYTWTKVPAFGAKTGLPNVIHLFRPLRPGQTRGVPYLAPVIETLKKLGNYNDYELEAAAVAALFTVFVKTASGGLDFNTSGMGQETGAKSTDTDLKMSGGAIIGLGVNESIETANPGRPNAAFEPFVTAIVEQIGTALEIPCEVIVRHFSSSYSASRAALLEAGRFFRGRRAWLAANFCQPVYEIFLYEAIATRRISAPGFFTDPILHKSYCNALWVGDAPGYIDPAKDVDAAVTRMEAKLSTLDEETTLLTGGDMEKNLPRIAQEIKMLDKIGLKHPAEGKSAPSTVIPAQAGIQNSTEDDDAANNNDESGDMKKKMKSRSATG